MDTKKLRQKILDLAIHGKLVPQDPNDEPASVLLERIRKEKEQLIKEGKIKAPKKSKSTSGTSHYGKDGPWKLPKGWVWTTLGSICSIKGGKRIPKGKTFSKDKTAHVYIRVTDMKNGSVDMEDLKYIDEDVYKEIRRYIIEKDDLYLTIAGTIGKVGEIPDALHGMNLTENAARLTEIECDKRYLMYSLMTDMAQSHFSLRFHQVAQPKLSIETSSSTPVAMPPLAEQKRIVRAIENIFNCLRLLDFNLAALEGDVINAKQLILDLAIHGKLVSQDPADEPALELLKRINPSFKPSDNLHYGDCPRGWQVVTLKEIIYLYSGRDLEAALCNSEHSGIPYLVGASCIDGKNISVYRWTEHPEVITKREDILLSCKGTVGQVLLNTLGDAHIARQFMAIRSRSSQLILPEYIEIIVSASIEKIKSNARGIIPGLSREDILEMNVAIPPLAEQKRILNRIHNIEQSLSLILLEISN